MSESPVIHDEFDRQRRRVLWALPTGLYLIGSRSTDSANRTDSANQTDSANRTDSANQTEPATHPDSVNLMTANLVVQVCLEPKLVGVAVEAESVTADLVARSEAFTISLLARADKDVVRRFVKPVSEVERAADGTVTTMSGQAVREVGAGRLPVLERASGHILCRVVRQDPLGSHILFIGEVVEVGGEPTEVLRMEDTRMHYGG
jgi:flavin reductase (DIM6/NTAB) family NADH-FMN oxidoreductase RutF